jgi:copper chaperone NosL
MMTRYTLLSLLFVGLWVPLYAEVPQSPQSIRLAQKGEKIASVLCDPQKLSSISARTTGAKSLEARLAESQACATLSSDQLEALVYYLSHESIVHTEGPIVVPEGSKCPVCGMFVSKYPKWAASMTLGDQTYYFDGVKDLMKYYLFDGDFFYDRSDVRDIMVTDYYTLAAIEAREAWYVYDSSIYGPMGRELIPFARQEAAEHFMQAHHGKRLVRFDDIDGAMVMALDGL